MTEAKGTAGLAKRPTGIGGLDAATHGGLPDAGVVVVLGQPGTGKTVLGLQILAAAVERGEAGIFVSFEESPEQILRNVMSFEWGATLAETRHLAIIDGRPRSDVQTSGHFDIEGLIAALQADVERLNAVWIVLDGIDRLLGLQNDDAAAVGEILRLERWCWKRQITAVLTAKDVSDKKFDAAHLRGVEFMVSTVLELSARIMNHRLHRRFRIVKYRGSAHVADELPVVLDARGVSLPSATAFATIAVADVARERVSSGVKRLDALLDGGYYRGSGILISGAPGTSKTTLGAAFAAAAASRHEKAILVSFDENEKQIIRNMESVGLDLTSHVQAGNLTLVARSPWNAIVEEHFMALVDLIDLHEPNVLVLDPISALLKGDAAEPPFPMIERLLAIAKGRGITTLMTSLTERYNSDSDTTLSHVSTIADTWITLEYKAFGGERNRALSIVKSRGAGHSNQVRELLLSERGIDLADVFEFGSEVLMGTARMQKESEVAETRQKDSIERQRRRRELDQRLKRAEAQIAAAESEMEQILAEQFLEGQGEEEADAVTERHLRELRRYRSADDEIDNRETS